MNNAFNFQAFKELELPSNSLKDIGGGAATSWRPAGDSMEMYDSIDDAGCTLVFETGDNSQCDADQLPEEDRPDCQ